MLSYDTDEQHAWRYFEFLKDHDLNGCQYLNLIDTSNDISEDANYRKGQNKHELKYKILVIYLLLSESENLLKQNFTSFFRSDHPTLKKLVSNELDKIGIGIRITDIKNILNNYAFNESFLINLIEQLPTIRTKEDHTGIDRYQNFERACLKLFK